MRFLALLTPALFLAACATGGSTDFSAAAVGQPDQAVECAAAAIEDEGFVVTEASESGLMHAQRGSDWIRMSTEPGDVNRYIINVEASDSDAARSAAQEIVNECGG